MTIDWFLKESMRAPTSMLMNYPTEPFTGPFDKYRPPSSRQKRKPKLSAQSYSETGPSTASSSTEEDNSHEETGALIQYQNSTDTNYTVFNIEPDYVRIGPGEHQNFSLVFKPIDPLKYDATIVSEIKYLQKNMTEITLNLSGKGVMPYVHFDTEFSDFISSGRRDISKEFLPGEWKVLEWKCLGLNFEHIRRFKIINPGVNELSYSWTSISKPDTKSTSNIRHFYCHRPNGIIDGKRFDICQFTIHSSTSGTFEEKYLFQVNDHKWIENFLLVAHVRDPKVACGNSVPIIKFKPTVLGINITENLILRNDETDADFKFEIEKRSLHASGYGQKLIPSETKGVVLRNSEKIIE